MRGAGLRSKQNIAHLITTHFLSLIVSESSENIKIVRWVVGAGLWSPVATGS